MSDIEFITELFLFLQLMVKGIFYLIIICIISIILYFFYILISDLSSTLGEILKGLFLGIFYIAGTVGALYVTYFFVTVSIEIFSNFYDFLFHGTGGEYIYDPSESPNDPGIHHVDPHWVDDYYRSDGTHVEGHWRGGSDGYDRSNPDGNPHNNLNR